AAKLTGWRIDIKSEEEKRREVEAQFEGLEMASETAAAESEGATEAEGVSEEPSEALPYSLAGIGDKTVRKLVEGGFATLEAVQSATVESLSEIPGIGGKTAEKILAVAHGEQGPPDGQDEGGATRTEE